MIGELKIASGQLLRRIGVGAVMCPVLAGIMATTIARPAAADSRATAYSIHMIAKIPSRCTLRDVSRIVVLEHVVPDDAVLSGGRFDHGRASFRLECNVPYHLNVRSRRARLARVAYLVPTSADAGEIAPFAVESRSAAAAGTPSVRCTLHDHAGSATEPCDMGGGDVTDRLLPRALGRIDITQAETVVADNANLLMPDEESVSLEIGGRP